MRELFLDYETYSAVPIGDCGAYRYINDPSFEPLLLAYAFDDDPVTCLDLACGDTLPLELVEALYSPAIVKHAWNCAFEREVTHKYFGRYCEPEQWEDTMVLAASCGLPLALGQCSEALNLSSDKAKDKAGRDLIRLFSCPRKPTKTNPSNRVYPNDQPEKWEMFKSYCTQDVVAERTIHRMLERWKPDETEHRIWCLDQAINDHGIKVDRTLAENAVDMGEKYKSELTAEAIAITGLDNPSSVAQVKDWLKEQEGLEVPSLNKKAVADVVASLKTEDAKQFMELRKELSKSSTKKYDAMLRSADTEDDHVRGCFQFFGGHTGRWAGRLVQLQNLPQNHMPDLDEARAIVRSGDFEAVECIYGNVTSTLSELIRTAIIPEEDCKFVVSDFSAIEARVTAALAGEEWRLQTFREGGDIYCASASQMFHVPVVKHGINGELRQKGKIAELALGYGGGSGALRAFGADKMGMSDEEMAETVEMWREASPNICDLWRKLERAAARCIVHKGTVFVPGVSGVWFDWESGIMWMRLPSGRRMAYYCPAYEESIRHPGRKSISYMGIDQQTRKWTRIETWGGRLTENLVQATARDILRDKMLAMTAMGYDIRAHVHDEVIINAPASGAEAVLKRVNEIMSEPLSWAGGIPLRGDGYVCDYYMKD